MHAVIYLEDAYECDEMLFAGGANVADAPALWRHATRSRTEVADGAGGGAGGVREHTDHGMPKEAWHSDRCEASDTDAITDSEADADADVDADAVTHAHAHRTPTPAPTRLRKDLGYLGKLGEVPPPTRVRGCARSRAAGEQSSKYAAYCLHNHLTCYLLTAYFYLLWQATHRRQPATHAVERFQARGSLVRVAGARTRAAQPYVASGCNPIRPSVCKGCSRMLSRLQP